MPRSTPPPDWVLSRRRQIGANIRAARLHANLTQQTISERTGIDRSVIVNIEHGHSAALVDTLILIADAIGIDLSQIVRQRAGPDQPPRRTGEG
ncbi:helix-turn-helix domain-containing protein [Streptomyces sp. NPDC058992]|uniref:helix-turn-helix domain-containing protein n=1 Tax=Streptomyces sp. NPDC058992 TaxID=3346688 RepID=UPI0036BE1C94